MTVGDEFFQQTKNHDERERLKPKGTKPQVATPDIEANSEVAGAGLTDVNLMERFHSKYKDLFIMGEDEKIMVYRNDGMWYSEESVSQIRAFVSTMPAELAQELAGVMTDLETAQRTNNEPDLERLTRQRDGIIKLIQRCGKGNTVGVISSLLLDRLKTVHIQNKQLMNPNPHILNCANGVVCLDSGELRWPRKEDLLTKRTPTMYDPDIDYQWWAEAVKKICGGSESLYEFLHTWVGYAATGLRRDHSMVILFGTGRNGKNMLMDAVAAALGPYAGKLPAGFIETAGGKTLDNNQMFALADLYGVRFAHASETGENGELRAAVIKAITGDDTISARQPRGEYFTFPITHKITLATNYKPQTSADDSALYDRLKLFPCTQRFGTKEEVEIGEAQYEADPMLLERTKTDEGRKAVLRWIVDGAIKFYAKGKLEVPVEIKVQIALHRKNMDYFENFLLQTTEYYTPEELKRVEDVEGPLGGPDSAKYKAFHALEDKLRVEVSTFYKMYRAWCQDQGIDRPKTQIALANYMTNKRVIYTDDDGGEHKMLKEIEKKKGGKAWFWKYIKLTDYGRGLLARVTAKESWEANNL